MSKAIEKYTKMLEIEGFRESKVRGYSKDGVGDFESYFDYLLDCKLAGVESLKAEKIWENMKCQINYLQLQAAKTSEDYLKLQNKNRWLESDLEEIRREKRIE